MRRPLIAALTAVLAVLALGACGDDGADGGSSPAAAPPASVGAPSAGASSDPAVTPSAAGSVDAAALCDFLEGEVASLESVGSPVGAQARFAGDFATWVEGGPNRQLTDAEELDAVTTAQCPEARSAILKAVGQESFATTF